MLSHGSSLEPRIAKFQCFFLGGVRISSDWTPCLCLFCGCLEGLEIRILITQIDRDGFVGRSFIGCRMWSVLTVEKKK